MENKNRLAAAAAAGLLVLGSLLVPSDISAQKNEVGYRKLMLGYTREQIKQIVNDNFIGEYTVDEERSDAIVLRKMYVHKPIILISLIFDHKNVLYKINVKIKKVTGTPPPDEVVKVIEDKYGAPQKRTISNTLDIMAYWYLDNNRYEIFFHNIASWDKFDVQYTDTVAQKQKEDYDREMNRKPVNRELDF